MHEVLPRTLQRLSMDMPGDCPQDKHLDTMFEEMGLIGEEEENQLGGNDASTWEAILCDVAGEAEGMSYAEVNRKRKRLTFRAFQDRDMISRTIVMECLVAANCHKMHALFQRSEALAAMHRLPPSVVIEIARLKQKCLGSEELS